MNDLTLQNSIDENLRPVKVAGQNSALEVSTEKVRVKDLEVLGSTEGVSASDSTKLPLAGGTMSGNVDFGDNDITNIDSLDADKFSIAGGTEMTAINEEDNMASDSATALATQQSIKAYADGLAGQVVGYTYLHPTDGTVTHEIQNSMTVEDSTHQITFNTPSSEKVEIELSCFINVGSTDTNIDVGLSDNSTYNSIGGQFEYDFAGVYLSDDEIDDDIITVKWVLGASELASVGASNTFYIGFSTAGSTKTANISYGYRSSHGVSNPPFIIKAISLPSSIYTG